MGLDGGTIPSRADILRRSSWRLANTSTSKSSRGGNVDNLPSGEPGQGTKQEQARLKWRICSLTSQPLKAPIVVCGLGKLYNRTSVLEFLLGEGLFVYTKDELKKNGFGHLTSIKNVTELKLTTNPAAVAEESKALFNTETTAAASGLFVCPVTQLETNGMHQFCVIKTCGHVFSEKALNLFQELNGCWTCNLPYTKEDIIPINGSEKVVEELQDKLQQKLNSEKEKKDKKRKRREEKKNAKKLAIEGPSSTTTTTTTTTTMTTTSTKGKEKEREEEEELGPEVTVTAKPENYEIEDDESLGPMVGPFQASAPPTSADRKRIRV